MQPNPVTPAAEPKKEEPITQKKEELAKPAGAGMFGQKQHQPPAKQDTKKTQKANALFAGIGGESKGESDDSDGDKKKKKKKKNKENEEVKQDLVTLEGGSTVTVTPSDGGFNLIDFDPHPVATPVT